MCIDRQYGRDPDFPYDGGFYSRQDNGSRSFGKDDPFKLEGGDMENSQIMSTDGDTSKPLNTHPISNSSAGSLDSGIVVNTRGSGLKHDGFHGNDEDKWLGVPELLRGKELGPLINPLPVSSDSDSESASG